MKRSTRPRLASVIQSIGMVLFCLVSLSGFATIPAFSATLPSTLNMGSNDWDAFVYGKAENDSLTYYRNIAVGDLNADGVDDLIVGSHKSSSYRGEVYVYFGGSGITGILDTAGTAGTAPNVTIKGSAAGDELRAWERGVGDVNGDGIDDLVLSADMAAPESRSMAGAVYVIYGGKNLSGVKDLAQDHYDVIIQGAAAGDRLGQDALCLADVNGDGIQDILMGAHYADPQGRGSAGALYVVFGTKDLDETIDLALGEEDLRVEGAANSDKLSFLGALASGDVNGDGILDILVGGPSINGTDTDSGAAYVIFGATDLSGTKDLAAGGGDVTLYGAESNSYLTTGRNLKAGGRKWRRHRRHNYRISESGSEQSIQSFMGRPTYPAPRF